MSAAVTVFKNNAIEMERLAVEQERAKSRAAEEQRAALHSMADLFEASVGSIVGSVAHAASEMQNAARSLSATAEETNKRAVAVSAAAAETTSSVQSVAAAAEELAASITEIGRQVTSARRGSIAPAATSAGPAPSAATSAGANRLPARRPTPRSPSITPNIVTRSSFRTPRWISVNPATSSTALLMPLTNSAAIASSANARLR